MNHSFEQNVFNNLKVNATDYCREQNEQKLRWFSTKLVMEFRMTNRNSCRKLKVAGVALLNDSNYQAHAYVVHSRSLSADGTYYVHLFDTSTFILFIYFVTASHHSFVKTLCILDCHVYLWNVISYNYDYSIVPWRLQSNKVFYHLKPGT